jgi:hypothetical protein
LHIVIGCLILFWSNRSDMWSNRWSNESHDTIEQ